jgi:hypothetical protein
MSEATPGIDAPVTPITIVIMMACYYMADPSECVGWNNNAGRRVRNWLAAVDLIDHNNKPTERGKAWVQFMLETPLPVAVTQWVKPE